MINRLRRDLSDFQLLNSLCVLAEPLLEGPPRPEEHLFLRVRIWRKARSANVRATFWICTNFNVVRYDLGQRSQTPYQGSWGSWAPPRRASRPRSGPRSSRGLLRPSSTFLTWSLVVFWLSVYRFCYSSFVVFCYCTAQWLSIIIWKLKYWKHTVMFWSYYYSFWYKRVKI